MGLGFLYNVYLARSHDWNKGVDPKSSHKVYYEAVNHEISDTGPLSSPVLEGLAEQISLHAVGRGGLDEVGKEIMSFGFDFTPPCPVTMDKDCISYNEPLPNDLQIEFYDHLRKCMWGNDPSD